MGTTYFGPYYEQIDAYSHEGYTVRVMPDGVETSTFGGVYGWDGHIGHRGRCECGWSGASVYPVSDPAPMEDAEAEWMRDHITPLVRWAERTVWPGWHRQATAQVAEVWGHVSAGRHREAVEVLTAMRAQLDAQLRMVEQLAAATARAESGWSW